jgi:hypothetical protein
MEISKVLKTFKDGTMLVEYPDRTTSILDAAQAAEINAKKDMKKTLLVNFYGGPGTGKSTICAGVFSKLKWEKVNCEMALEYAKDMVWEGSFNKMDNQIYIFAKQFHRVFRLLGKVDVILTDSPLLLSLYYGPNEVLFREFVVSEYQKLNNMDIFLQRMKDYNPAGRMQTLDEAKVIDDKLKTILDQNARGKYLNIVGERESEETIANLILESLGRNKISR